MPIELEDCWLRWRRGETIEALAKEYKVTRERMRIRLNKLDQTHPAMLREAALEEAAKVAEQAKDLGPLDDFDTGWNAGLSFATDAIRALKNQNPDSTAGDK